MPASPLPNRCTLLALCPQPQVKVTNTSTPATGPTVYAYTHGAPRHFAGDQQGTYLTTPTSLLGGEAARVAQVYPRPQDSAPQGMAPTGCHYGTPAPIATQPVSTVYPLLP